MAYYPAAADVLRLSAICADNNTPPQLGVNTTHWLVQSVVGGGVTQASIASYFDNLLGPLYVSYLPATARYRGHMVQKIYPGIRVVAESNATQAANGGGGGNMLPAQVAYVISFQTSLAGRPYRGRIYLPFISTTFLSATQGPTGALQVVANNIASVLYAPNVITVGAGVTTLYPIIFHAKAGRTGTPAAGSATLVTNYTVHPAWATIRRRSDRGRPNYIFPI